MHYIAGTEITIAPNKSSGKIRPGMTGAQIRAMSQKSSTFTDQREKLKPGVKYTLTRVYKQDETLVYKFMTPGEIVELQFDSVASAEKFISEVRSEELPDYDTAYREMTD